MRVCQFRHDGKCTCSAAATHRRRVRKTYLFILQTLILVSNCQADPRLGRSWIYSSFASIVIFAFSTFDTGHPFSAASAYFWNVAASAPGTFPTTSIWLAVIVHPESTLSSESVTVVEMLSGV